MPRSRHPAVGSGPIFSKRRPTGTKSRFACRESIAPLSPPTPLFPKSIEAPRGWCPLVAAAAIAGRLPRRALRSRRALRVCCCCCCQSRSGYHSSRRREAERPRVGEGGVAASRGGGRFGRAPHRRRCSAVAARFAAVRVVLAATAAPTFATSLAKSAGNCTFPRCCCRRASSLPTEPSTPPDLRYQKERREHARTRTGQKSCLALVVVVVV